MWDYYIVKNIELLDFDLIEIYRFVTPQEYYVKLKEKYDAICLNIVLTRLVMKTLVVIEKLKPFSYFLKKGIHARTLFYTLPYFAVFSIT